MNIKFFLSWIVVFVVWMAGSFAVHGAWLSDLYGTMPNIMRTKADSQALFHFFRCSPSTTSYSRYPAHSRYGSQLVTVLSSSSWPLSLRS